MSSLSVLTDDDIRARAPSVFADRAHESRKDSYLFIPTTDVLGGLRKAGFEPVFALQTRCRNEDKRLFTKHMLRLRHPDASNRVGDYVPEVVLVNSHDGTSSYQILAGIFRIVCSNGMVAGNDLVGVKLRHSARLVDDVIEGSFRVIEDVERLDGQIQEMKRTVLPFEQREEFAHRAKLLRFGNDSAVNELDLLHPRRGQDWSPDLWTTFNVVQENLLRGGVQYRTARGRHMSTRAVGGVTENLRVNQHLWNLAASYTPDNQVQDVEVRELEPA